MIRPIPENARRIFRQIGTAIRKLKECVVLWNELSERKKVTKGEDELKSAGTIAESDFKLLREILERI